MLPVVMIGTRIKESRRPIGFSQQNFADALGVSKRTVIDWEKDRTSPTAQQLFIMSNLGFDILYIVTGKCMEATLAKDESELLAKYRVAPFALKAAAHGTLSADLSE